MGVQEEKETTSLLMTERVESNLTPEEMKVIQLNVADEETEMLRYKMLKGKHMLYVTGSHLYPSFAGMLRSHVLELIKHGVIVHMVFAKENKYYTDALENNCFHKAIIVDFTDLTRTNAVNIVKALKELGLEGVYDGVFTPHEATQALAANVQELLNLPGNPVESYQIAQNKYRTRKALEAANLNTAKAASITTLDDIENAVEVVGFPMFTKPTTGMGSAGCYKVTDRQELSKVVLRTLEDIKNNWALSNGRTEGLAPILAETFIEPINFGDNKLVQEFDVEILMWNGECVYANVVDNWAPIAPYFQDRGFHCPSWTSKEIQQELIDYCAQAVKALGFKVGNFHMEAWYTKTGPVLIECNPRVGGGSISLTHKKVYGVDPMMNFALSMLNIPVNPPRFSEPQCSYGFVLVNAAKTGVLRDGDFLKNAIKNEFVVDSLIMKASGSSCIGYDTAVPEVLAQIDFESKANAVYSMVAEMQKVSDNVVAAASAGTTSAYEESPVPSKEDK